MKQVRYLIGFIALLVTPFVVGGQVFAGTISVGQELHVTAIVPAHREMIIDNRGKITRVTSNTPEDVTPSVYYLNDASESNRRPLTAALYAQYRQIVPEGTAKTGVIYKRPLLADLMVSSSVKPINATSFISRLLNS